ncbi:serine/threonine protein kinase [Halostreptopolyspora alba]|uniref:non-specific serine/threonine protein kinase n=2 Tax=Halostreptopolyspora alba TaxID=2487137 RepID=A0A3N0E6B0_9ACTN|nr:serine/threonine protein kinase [Nocardiopsaceae bacterium YIM 96095]
MGTVWRATDTVLNRTVAVKLLHPSQMAQPTSRERFRTEGRITAGLSHPGIAQVFDYGEQGDNAYLIMELVPGEPLSSILRRKGALEPGVTLDIVAQTAQALAAAHARGVVHRDMKPGNLLVTEDGAVKLTDFGIARGNESVTLTQTGMVMGTAQYISPEQASGGSATYASDIYALGVVAYECLAGHPPFTADTPLALALAHTREPPPPLPEEVPHQLRAFVEQLLEKSPEKRASSAGEVAQLAHQLSGGVASTDATTAMDLADPGQTMVASAAPDEGGPSTRPSSLGAGAPPGAGSQDGGGSSDRLAGRSKPKRRPSLPVVFGVIAAAVVLVGGVVLAGWLWGGDSANETVGDRQSDTNESPSSTPENESEPSDPQPEEPESEQQDVPEQPQFDETSDPEPQDPSPESNDSSTEPASPGEGEEPDPGGDNGGEDDGQEQDGEDPSDPGEGTGNNDEGDGGEPGGN